MVVVIGIGPGTNEEPQKCAVLANFCIIFCCLVIYLVYYSLVYDLILIIEDFALSTSGDALSPESNDSPLSLFVFFSHASLILGLFFVPFWLFISTTSHQNPH